ncbi:MAG: sugar phosphate isomerase/epimerase family protein [Planctomycetota bacterium]|jgi:sugar phosphate isomerase/epimerase
MDRRRFLGGALGVVGAGLLPSVAQAASPTRFRLRYLLASCLYGYADLKTILPEVRKTGADVIDIWPKVHGSQREQLEEMGEACFSGLLGKHGVRLGCISQFKLGPFGLRSEMRLASRLGCRTMVTGARGAKGLKGGALKSAVGAFIEKMKPHLAVAEETGVTIAIENHANSLIESPDSLKWLAELARTPRLAIALSPYHLGQDPKRLADLIRALGRRIRLFYAWQHGMGCNKKLPKDQELLQMPGRGPLDFSPLLKALKDIDFKGYTEMFMHPVPRGVPILDSPQAVTAEINRARRYLEDRLRVMERSEVPSTRVSAGGASHKLQSETRPDDTR